MKKMILERPKQLALNREGADLALRAFNAGKMF